MYLCSGACKDISVSADRRQAGGVDPPFLYPDYRSTERRAPRRAPLRIQYGPSELSGPSGPALLSARSARHTARASTAQDTSSVGPSGRPPLERGRDDAADLTRQHAGEPIGERIIVHGRVVDAGHRPLADTLIEIWQANAAGRYAHEGDQHPAPLDPNFTGAGACLTDAEGRYRFVTIKPGAYPWRNHPNAWRPAHIHFSLLGRCFSQRLITQMYFPGDPLLAHDPIYRSIASPGARERLVAAFDPHQTAPEWALAYRFDITLGGREARR
jgi:protocatechuate 3,4-dioxygenase beta subunit